MKTEAEPAAELAKFAAGAIETARVEGPLGATDAERAEREATTTQIERSASASGSPSARCPPWAPPLLAVQFLTRLPVPAIAQLSGEGARVGLGRAVGWFPLVGALLGASTAVTMLIVAHFWPPIVAVIVALIVEARLTGAFHEDAVADFCDGIGGGRDPAHVREIMKDSRIGTFGMLGLALALALRAALMYSTMQMFPFDMTYGAVSIIAAATLGRLLAVIVMATSPPAPATGGLAKDIVACIRGRDVALAVGVGVAGLLPFALEAPRALLFALLACGLFVLWFRALLARRVGGCTGDCLGFAAYAGQLILLMAATVGG